MDNSAITYRVTECSETSRTYEGAYSLGMSRDDVEKLVQGTFGGRFEQFGGGRFRYIAYTD
jgi:hypothetical protein